MAEMKTRHDYLMAMVERTMDQASAYNPALGELRKIADEHPHLQEALNAAGDAFENARDALARAAGSLAAAALIAKGDEPLLPESVASANATERQRLS